MTRILFLHHTAVIGGAELQLLSVARHFRESCEVLLFNDGPLRNTLEKNGVRVRVFSSKWAASGVRGGTPSFSVRNMADVLRLAWLTARAARGVDIMIANSPRALLVASLARLVRRKPLMWILHDLLDETHFSLRGIRLIVRTANKSASRILSDSKANAAAFVGAGGNAGLVRIVYCGVEAPALTEQKLADTRTIGVFGRITPWKGHDIVLRALANVRGVVAWFVGAEDDAAYAKSLRVLANDLGITDRVNFLGFRDDVAQLMQSVGCIMHASIAPEPFGLVIVEGMLAQRPVIATIGGGASEIIEDGVSGLLVRPGNADELGRAIERIFSDPTAAARMAQNGYERARTLFSRERQLKEISQHLEEIAGR